ncbi:MAG: metallophosphoesterase [Salinirussus sp.]
MTGTDPTGDGPVLARLPRPRIDDRVRIAVVADPHLAVDRSGTWKVARRSRARLATAVADAGDLADVTVLAGDLTRDGTRAEFDAVDDVLADLPEPWVAIPGNHDVPKRFDDHDGLPVAAFERRYGSLPGTVSAGPVTLLCLNTASTPDGRLRGTWGGRVGEAGRAWLSDRLAGAETPVVVCHHNLAPLPENPGGKWENFPLQDAAAVRELLRRHEVRLAVTAHHHVPAVAEHGPTTELLAPATCSYPQAWLLLEVGPDGTTARLVPLAGPEGIREASRAARTGKPLGVGIAEMVDRRLDGLPLVDRGQDRSPTDENCF